MHNKTENALHTVILTFNLYKNVVSLKSMLIKDRWVIGKFIAHRGLET